MKTASLAAPLTLIVSTWYLICLIWRKWGERTLNSAPFTKSSEPHGDKKDKVAKLTDSSTKKSLAWFLVHRMLPQRYKNHFPKSLKCFNTLTGVSEETFWICSHKNNKRWKRNTTYISLHTLEVRAGTAHQTQSGVVYRLLNHSEGEWKRPLVHIASIEGTSIHHGDSHRQNMSTPRTDKIKLGAACALFTGGIQWKERKEINSDGEIKSSV